ncbi:hypothetical protein CANARDRAFT_28910 [[Candida] arabinofermentans NRRL YB-2248]|uniref:D-serine dehydratase n=1 Tax=[Candida] arabinofermentans NRRL YB-2248 TaxID=983967 RepID=A0A1E4SZ66_9ASCO|nr:hypothetical protein CANARDRAFT_28910 [[Candida] arabinofermentans NRRL YB-2248]
MSYPYKLTPVADKEALLKSYKGLKLDELPTPSFIIKESIFIKNSERMLQNANRLNADFRAHVKTHKTLEGTVYQLGSGQLKTDKIVVSTLMEAWGLLPLIKSGAIKDVLFSLPVVKSRLDELVALGDVVPELRLMLDNAEQLQVLVDYSKKNNITKKWSIFIKINMGTDRAGFKNDSIDTTLETLLKGETKEYVSLYGFYCHAGHSYASKTEDDAKKFLLAEIENANFACSKAMEIDPTLKLQLSVGATPTAHASGHFDLSSVGKVYGNLELHAGNYPFCDLQQMETNCVTIEDVSCGVLAEVLSTYPSRGKKGPGEQLVNAGAIALAREFGPLPGHGRIYSPAGYENWIVGRLSQEHGILTPLEDKETPLIPLGTKVRIVPQHSCITAAAYPWYYIIDDNDVVTDIWVSYRGW